MYLKNGKQEQLEHQIADELNKKGQARVTFGMLGTSKRSELVKWIETLIQDCRDNYDYYLTYTAVHDGYLLHEE